MDDNRQEFAKGLNLFTKRSHAKSGPVKKFCDTWIGRGLPATRRIRTPSPRDGTDASNPLFLSVDSESNLASQAPDWISPETMECVAQLMEEQNVPSRQILSASGGT
jgi:hypothetical protein